LHDDYEVAPVGAIQLSNSGEIKALQKDEKKADTGPVLHAEGQFIKIWWVMRYTAAKLGMCVFYPVSS